MRTGLAVMIGLFAGCGQPAATGNTAALDPTAVKPAAMTDVDRRVVFHRALLDAGYPCRKVTKVEDMPRTWDGHPMWRVVCDEGEWADYTVTLLPGGIFKADQIRPAPT